MTVRAKLCFRGEQAEAERSYPYREGYTRERMEKIAVGDAVTNVCETLRGYRPAWGMLTGVRPSKVATELLQRGMSKTRVKKELARDYFVIPKKASLATEVAVNEARLIGTPGKRDCSVYISIPFCPTRCAYCSFVSYTSKRLLSLIPRTIGFGETAFDGALITNARQAAALARAAERCEAALYAAQCGMTPDAVVMDAEGAIAALGEITGETVTESVVTRIFSDFCVGK